MPVKAKNIKVFEWRVGSTLFTKWSNGQVSAISKSNI